MLRSCVLLMTFLIFKSVAAENVSVSNGSHAHNVTHIEESEFPEDLFTEEQRRHGAIVLHVILAVYCFVAIASVCENYFMPTIRCICEALSLSDDVAAATFMSIATSSPELFTNIIGTFMTNSDIGVGHVLGNAYYDMFFVASLGGLAASKKIVLEWWPIARDCAIYLIVAITLTWVVWDGVVETYETAILLALYIVYFVIMFNNKKIIRYLNMKFKLNIDNPFEVSEPKDHIEGTSNCPTETSLAIEEVIPLGNKIDEEEEDGFDSLQTTNNKVKLQQQKDGNKWSSKISTILVAPISILNSWTIPDVRKSNWKKFYPVSFVMCVCWIGVSTYLGTWMISVIGATIGVPDIIMGMVFMAAGGSVVEAYGVYYKARRGECSIGLSNSMGCNTLDVTMCLALPWLVKTLLPSTPGPGIVLSSEVIHVNCILLIVSVLVIFALLYINQFRLDWKLGIFSGVAYVSVLAIAITVETVDVRELLT